MQDIRALFIDDGGVLNDNAIRGPEWQRLVGKFFVPILGGDQAAWVKANRMVEERLSQFAMRGPRGPDYLAWWGEYQKRWLREMASFAGVTAPLDDAECVILAKEASLFITRNVRSAYPGAADAVRLLHGRGLDLYTASGEVSWELDGYLTGMGIRDHFLTLYGPDLINQGKWEGAEYYRKAFVHAGVDPKHVLVVDDSPLALARAHSLGARTCLVAAAPPQGSLVDLVVSRLAELPDALIGSS